MNFTREPIIETIISAKEGYKLSIKSSKNPQSEEYLVDALEVVSYGGSFFYRCQERPKTFFLPVGDFEIVEVKETRILIRNPNIERSIKIAGGKEASIKPSMKEDQENAGEAPAQKEGQMARGQEQKRDKKKGRNRRSKNGQLSSKSETLHEFSADEKAKSPDSAPLSQEENKAQERKPTVFSHLLTPPPGLISDTIERYKQTELAPKTLAVDENELPNEKKSKVPHKKTKTRLEFEIEHDHESFRFVDEEDTLNQALISEHDFAGTTEDEVIAADPPKPGEALEEKEITTEPFVKVTHDKDSK